MDRLTPLVAGLADGHAPDTESKRLIERLQTSGVPLPRIASALSDAPVRARKSVSLLNAATSSMIGVAALFVCFYLFALESVPGITLAISARVVLAVPIIILGLTAYHLWRDRRSRAAEKVAGAATVARALMQAGLEKALALDCATYTHALSPKARNQLDIDSMRPDLGRDDPEPSNRLRPPSLAVVINYALALTVFFAFWLGYLEMLDGAFQTAKSLLHGGVP